MSAPDAAERATERAARALAGAGCYPRPSGLAKRLVLTSGPNCNILSSTTIYYKRPERWTPCPFASAHGRLGRAK